MRTQKQIIAQLEARYAEMEREAASPMRQFPCQTCIWRDVFHTTKCNHPLVIGFDKERVLNVDYMEEIARPTAGILQPRRKWSHLCGPEKALWETKQPKEYVPSFLDRLINWLDRRG